MTNRDLVSALQKDESWISSVEFAHAKNDALRHGIFDHRILRRALRDVAPERLNVEELIQCMHHFDVVMPFAGGDWYSFDSIQLTWPNHSLTGTVAL